jgi:hypothetical protein
MTHPSNADDYGAPYIPTPEEIAAAAKELREKHYAAVRAGNYTGRSQPGLVKTAKRIRAQRGLSGI